MHKVKILDIKPVTHNVKSYTVEKPAGYVYTPGQATDVAINLPGFKNKTHPFTFTSLNSDPNLEFIIKSYPVSQYPNHEGVTEKLAALPAGDELLIDDPWGTIQYKGPGVFIAGGAGITPFIAILRQLHKDNKINSNKLIFSNKTHKDIILEEELKKIFINPYNLILTLTQEKSNNYGYGRIDKNFLQAHIQNFSQHFYVCGPKPMVADIKEVLSSLGANIDSIVFEK